MQDDKRIPTELEEEYSKEPFEGSRKRGRYSKRVGDQRAKKGKSSPETDFDWIPGKSWCWHLAPDGSFSTVDATTATTTRPPAATGTRIRGLQFGSEPASASGRSSMAALRREAKWEEKFQLLLEYKEKHKTGYVPSNDPILGGWAYTQRSAYTSKKLSKHRFQKLNSIGFVWNFRDSSNSSEGRLWMEMYQILKERQRHCKGNHRLAARKSKLWRWIGWQRYCYNRGTLSKNRIDLLDPIGFEWEPMETTWMAMYQRLKAFEERHGHTLVPFRYKQDPKLATWVQRQRQYCNKQDRVDLLNDLGFVWSAIDFQSSMANHALAERSNK